MRLLWLLVFAVEGWLLFNAVPAAFIDPSLMKIYGLTVLLLSALGTLGYAFRVKIANAKFWLVCCFVIGVWCVVTLAPMLWNLPHLESESGRTFPLSNMLAGVAVVAVWFFLQWYAIFAYSRFLTASALDHRFAATSKTEPM